MAEGSSSQKLVIKLDYRILSLVLLLVILGMLAAWRPWARTSSTQRKVQVTGQTTLKAEPDQYQFSPSYSSKNTDKAKAIEELSAKSTEVTKKLKELGVADNEIKSSTNTYPTYYPERAGENTTATLTLTVTVTNKDIVQKIQDYLITTSPSGQISPYASFSESKQKELQSQGREKAIEDAKKQAEESAKNLGVKVGKVIEVSDVSGFSIMPYAADGVQSAEIAKDTRMSLAVQAGENEYPFSVNVTFSLQ